MQQQYWTTKQAVFKKLGKKEDDCIIASDLELDLKLELYQTIEESFTTLLRVLENYQEKLCTLSQEENALGRFLKENGKQDKTKAGNAMRNAGQAFSYSAQQRLTLRIPLVRLYQEVETFQYRALVDTFQTVEKMEKARTAYRGSLLWMKDVSQQLDPDTCKQMEKFRKVQGQVRRAKQRFDKMKIDTLEKVDLLSFSRCNLFSQALTTYQNALLNVSKKISHSSNSVALMTKGYQQYEFSMLKELECLSVDSKKLTEKPSEYELCSECDEDTLTFFEPEYHDEVTPKNDASRNNNTGNEKVINNTDSQMNNTESNLTPLNEETFSITHISETHDLLSNSSELLDSNNDLLFLQEAILSDKIVDKYSGLEETEYSTIDTQKSLQNILPSNVLDANNSQTGILNSSNDVSHFSNIGKENSSNKTVEGKNDLSAWYSLFADLDPLANPDLIGKKTEDYEDRNC